MHQLCLGETTKDENPTYITMNTEKLSFHSLSLHDREAVQAIVLQSDRRNCNFTFSNLIGWQFLFDTEVCLLSNTIIFRYMINGESPIYLINSKEFPSEALIATLFRHAAESGHALTLNAVEDQWAELFRQRYSDKVTVRSIRDSFDYIYRRDKLESLQGKNLKKQTEPCQPLPLRTS